MSDNDELMARLAELVQVLRQAGLEPVLIGGLAVYQRRHVSTAEIDLRSPASLANLPRTTTDIDLAIRYEVGAEKKAASCLQNVGLSPASSNAWCFRGDGIQIDLVPCIETWESEDSFRVERDRIARPLAPTQVSMEALAADVSVGIGKRAILILQKTLAWTERYKGSDLADIATLAISDQVERGDASIQLEELMATLPADYAQRLRKVAERFENEDGDGPAAFYAAIVDVLRARFVRVTEEDELVIRQIASMAVRRLLAASIAQ